MRSTKSSLNFAADCKDLDHVAEDFVRHLGKEANIDYLQQQQQRQQAERPQKLDEIDELSVSSDGMLSTDSQNVVYNTEMLRQFEEYCEACPDKYMEFEPKIKAGIELMKTLSDRRVPWNLYDDIMEWHDKHSGDTSAVVSQYVIMNRLAERYNSKISAPKVVKDVILPCSKAKVNLVMHDAKAQIVSMLTDPRIKDDDWLFHNDDPFCPPPKDFKILGDINTGRAYRETYKKLVKDPTKDVLFPFIYYIDGTVVGMYDNMPVEAFKLTNGLLKRNIRNKTFASRFLGYVTLYFGAQTQGSDLIHESQCMDADDYLSDNDKNLVSDDEEEVVITDADGKPMKMSKAAMAAQDWHFMLNLFLQSYLDLQEEGGFEWSRAENIPKVKTILPLSSSSRP